MIRVGTAGWSIPRIFADQVSGEGPHLERYARRFAGAEINATFYRPVRESTLRKWADAVSADFLFAVKAPRAITHEAKLACDAAALADFLAMVRLLGKHLGPILFQLPPRLPFDSAVAERFLDTLRTQHEAEVAFEPRNASWFTDEVSAMFARYRIARVAADPAKIPEAAEPGGWDGLRYYRLHGSPRMYYSAYTPEYLDALAAALTGVKEAWIVFDNTASGAALGNALELSERIVAAAER